MSDAQNPPRTSTQRPVAAEAQAQARARAQSNGVGNAHDNNNDNGGSRSSSVTTASGNDHGNGGAAGYKSPYQPVSQPQFHSQLPPHLRMQTQAQHPQAQHPQAQHPQAQHPQAQAQSQSPTQSQSQSQSQTSTHAQAQFRAIHARNQRLQQTTYMPGTFRPLASRPPPVMVPPPPQTGQIAKRQAEPENHQHQHHQAPPPDPAPAAKRQRTTQQDARHPPSVPGPYVPGAPYVPRDMSKLPDLPHHFVQQPDMSKLPELPPHFILQPDICKPDSSSSSTSTSNQPGKFSYDMKIITLTSIVHLETWTQQVEAMARACGCFRELTTRFGNFPRPGTVEAFICQTRFMASWRILAESISGHVWAYMRVLGFSLIPVFKGADGVLWQPAPVDVFYYAREAGARLLMPGSREQSRLEVRRMVEELRTGRPDDYPSERHHKKGHKWLKSILDNLIRNGDGAVCEALYDVKPDWAPAQWRRPPVAVLGREGGVEVEERPWEGLPGNPLPGRSNRRETVSKSGTVKRGMIKKNAEARRRAAEEAQQPEQLHRQQFQQMQQSSEEATPQEGERSQSGMSVDMADGDGDEGDEEEEEGDDDIEGGRLQDGDSDSDSDDDDSEGDSAA